MSQDFPIKPNSFSVPLIGCPLSLTLCSGWSWRTLRPHPHRGARAGSSWWLCGRGCGPATDWALIGGFVSYSMDIMDVSLIPDGALRNGEWRKQSVGQSNIYMLINTITNYARVCVHFLGLLIKPTTTNKTHTHTRLRNIQYVTGNRLFLPFCNAISSVSDLSIFAGHRRRLVVGWKTFT